MDKRVLLTVAISMGILFLWTKFFMPAQMPQKTAAQQQAQQQDQQAPPNAPAATATAGRKPGEPALETKAQPAGEAKAPAAERPPEVRDTIEFPGRFRAEFSTWGAAPVSWTLLDPQFKETEISGGKHELQQIDLVRTHGAQLPLVVTFAQADIPVPADAAWSKAPAGQNELAYVWENDQVHVEKRFVFTPGSYRVDLKITVENKGDKPLNDKLQVQMAGWQDPSVKPGGMFSQRFIQTEGLCDLAGKLKHKDLAGLLKEPIDEGGLVRWTGVDEKYFVQAVAAPSKESGDRRCTVSAQADGVITAFFVAPPRTVAPKQKSEHEFVAYLGPKFLHELDAVTVGGEDAKLGDAVNYGWTEAIARPMLAVLKAVHVVVPNWGFAVIVLTILLKALTWWPTTKSMKSMREMSKLKPEMDKLKARFGDDKQKFNIAVMGLYKERGISPLGGCLPMLIQMPIYIALYAMLGNSVELYRSSWVVWIHDLTAPDPYFVLPLLTGVLMFAQQRFSPTPPDPQQKMMMWMMPVMFTAFSIFLPAGLTIYILTNTLLTMLQQWYLNRGQGPVGKPTPAAKPAKA